MEIMSYNALEQESLEIPEIRIEVEIHKEQILWKKLGRIIYIINYYYI